MALHHFQEKNVEAPLVNNIEFHLLSADAETGEVQLVPEVSPLKYTRQRQRMFFSPADIGKKNTCVALSAKRGSSE